MKYRGPVSLSYIWISIFSCIIYWRDYFFLHWVCLAPLSNINWLYVHRLISWYLILLFCWFMWLFSCQSIQFSSVAQSCPTLCWPHEQQHTRPPCTSPTARVYPNTYPLSWWCHPTISSSVVPFSSCPQPFPASGPFPMSQLFASGGQSIGVSASESVLPMNTQDWSPLGWTGWISLQSKGLSRVFSNTTVQKHQFFGAQLSL